MICDIFWLKYSSVSNLYQSEFDFTTKIPMLAWSFRFRGKYRKFIDKFFEKG